MDFTAFASLAQGVSDEIEAAKIGKPNPTVEAIKRLEAEALLPPVVAPDPVQAIPAAAPAVVKPPVVVAAVVKPAEAPKENPFQVQKRLEGQAKSTKVVAELLELAKSKFVPVLLAVCQNPATDNAALTLIAKRVEKATGILAEKVKAAVEARVKPSVQAAPDPSTIQKEVGTKSEQKDRAKENTETVVTAPPKEVGQVKNRPSEIDPDKLHLLKDIPAPLNALVEKSLELQTKRKAIQDAIAGFVKGTGQAENEANIFDTAQKISVELKKVPEQAYTVGSEILALFQREKNFKPNLTKKEQGEIEDLKETIVRANTTLTNAKKKIEKILGDSGVEHGGTQEVSEHIQMFPNPDLTKTHRGEGKDIQPTKASLLDSANTLMGATLNEAQKVRLQAILAGIGDILESVVKELKSLAKMFTGFEEKASSLLKAIKDQAKGGSGSSEGGEGLPAAELAGRLRAAEVAAPAPKAEHPFFVQQKETEKAKDPGTDAATLTTLAKTSRFATVLATLAGNPSLPAEAREHIKARVAKASGPDADRVKKALEVSGATVPEKASPEKPEVAPPAEPEVAVPAEGEKK